MCMYLYAFPSKPEEVINSMRSGSGIEFLKFH